MKDIILVIPRISEFKTGIHYGQYLHLSALFIEHGYEVLLYDENREAYGASLSEKVIEVKASIVIIIFNKVDLLKSRHFIILINELKKIKNIVQCIIGIGYIAEAYKKYLVDYKRAVDFVVSQSSVFFNLEKNNSLNDFPKEIAIIQNSYNKFHSLDKETLCKLDYKIGENDILSVHSSLGCDNNCTFCGYNLHIPKRMTRPIKNLVDEIAFFETEYNIKRIVISDNSFSNSEIAAWQRLSEFIKNKKYKNVKSSLTINIPLSALSKRVVEKLKVAGCANILIGIESFNQDTLKQFNKYMDLSRLFDIVSECDDKSIVCTLSYIMFHPWQTISSLKHELSIIEKIGRFRIPQFFSNSILTVIPNTIIAHYLENKKWLVRRNETEISFCFQDEAVKGLYHNLKDFYDSKIEDTEYRSYMLQELKEHEWSYLKKLVG